MWGFYVVARSWRAETSRWKSRDAADAVAKVNTLGLDRDWLVTCVPRKVRGESIIIHHHAVYILLCTTVLILVRE